MGNGTSLPKANNTNNYKILKDSYVQSKRRYSVLVIWNSLKIQEKRTLH